MKKASMSRETSKQRANHLSKGFNQILAANPDRALDAMRHGEKITLNADDLFHLSPEYATRPEKRPVIGPKLYPIAAQFIDRSYKRLLSKPPVQDRTVLFTAGGSATGKSTILRKAGRRVGVDFIVDTTFSNTHRALSQVDRALAAGRKVEIHYVFRDFRECVISMLKRALNPRSGRLVPIDDMARTHFGAQLAVLAALERYQRDRRVLIQLHKNVGVGRRRLSKLRIREFSAQLYESIDELQRLGQNTLDGFYKGNRRKRTRGHKNHDTRRRGLSIPIAIYKAARSKAQRARKTSR
jgi:hypothetical protein